jgi:hypothetical protein
VVGAPWQLPARAFAGRHILVMDGVRPYLAELDAVPADDAVGRACRAARGRLALAAARADAVLVAGEAQRRWWRERLGTRSAVPLLELPDGIPDRDPPAERDEVAGIPADWAIVLWWGGAWPWLDLDTLLAARAALGKVPLAVVVPTAPRPAGPGAADGRLTKADLRAAQRRFELAPPQLFALDQWLPYDQRHRLLHRTSLIAALDRPLPAATLGLRARVMDGVWAGVPLLVTRGGESARLVEDNHWGAVVPAGDPERLAAVLEVVLAEREQLRFRANLAASRERWRWTTLAEPLARLLRELPTTGRGSRTRSACAALAELWPRRR